MPRSTYIKQLKRYDYTLSGIELHGKQYTDKQLVGFVDCLLTHVDVTKHIYLDGNKLTSATGTKIAQYLSISKNVKCLDLARNKIDEETYLVIANGLRVNSSLISLYLYGNNPVDRIRVDTAFIIALRLNPVRPIEHYWDLYTFNYHNDDLDRLMPLAEKSTPPSMLEFLLCVHLNPVTIETKKTLNGFCLSFCFTGS